MNGSLERQARPMAMDAQPPHLDPQLFKRVMGRFASGVTVITSRTPGGVHGMTASAFMSGSLDPPLVVVSVGKQTKLHRAIDDSGVFGVSILAREQELHSRHFSGCRSGCEPSFARFAEIPVLDGSLASVCARVEQAHPCGDHSLFVGRVVHLSLKEGEPLLYFTGGYCRLEGAVPSA